MSDGEKQQNLPRVFISYAQYEPAHSEQVLALAHALAADGLDVELDQFHGHETVDWPRWCEERLEPENTDFVLMVCTAEYRRRIQGKVELDQGRGVFWEGNLIYGYLYRAKANERFVPLLLDEEPGSSLPPAVANWNHFRLQDFGLQSADQGYEDLYRLLTDQPAALKPVPGKLKRLPPRPVPHPERARPDAKPINLPYRSLGTLFKGREGLLAAIHTGFAGEHSHAQVIVARHAIHGLGGIGKTRAAVEYAWRHFEDYSALLFVTAQSPEDLRTKLAALCDTLGLARSVTEEAERERAALDWLADPANTGWLLIVDNVDTEEAAQAVEQTLANLTGGHLLITGRLSEWPADIQARRVDVLDAEAARDFLLERPADKRRAAADDPEQAMILAGELGYLALALEQAAAFMRRHALTFAEYRRRWQAADQKVLQWHDPRTMQYERPLAATWQASIEDLPPAARGMLDLLAWLAPEPLPRFLFDHAAAPEGGGHLFEDAQDPRQILCGLCGGAPADPEEALAALRDLSLLQPTAEAEFPSEGQVHRVLALITRERQAGEARSAALQAALVLVNAAAVGDPQDVRTWPILEPLQSHTRALVDHAESAGIAEPTARLLNGLGVLLQTKARHAEAEPLMRRALAIDEASLGPEHPDVARDLNNLAALLQATNRPGEAEPLFRLVVEIFELSYGPDHPNVATALNNLARLLQATNRPGEAEPLMRRALTIDEASYGPEHPDVAIDLNNLAQLLKATNRPGEAEPLMRRALGIDEAGLGPEHPNVARDLNNLAQLLKATNRPGEAEPLMRRALAIDEASLGPEHPDVARDLNNLAQLLKATNRPGEAEPLMRRVVEIFESSYGPDHPNVATALNNLAALLQATNRPGEAEPLYRRALGIDEASYGPEHPDVARDLNNLAQLLKATNRPGEAEPLMRRVVEIFESSYGPDHPNVATALNNLARLLQATNRPGEAEPLMRRALTIDEASYGTEHPDVAIDLNNLAWLLQATNRPGEAEPLYRRALGIDEASLGPEHPNVARDLNNLAQLLQATNRPGEAEPLYRRALGIDEASYGPDHPNVAIDLNNLAQLLQATNRPGEAEPLYRRALGIDEASYGPEHPNVAIRLNNLAWLLQDTNRPGEAEPLMRRHLVIFLKFTRDTGHHHPHVRAAIGNYRELLGAMALAEEELGRRLLALGAEAGLGAEDLRQLLDGL